MNTIRTQILAATACLLSHGLTAQTFTVDAGDLSADFQSLSTALATVPSGATILLRSDIVENGGDSVFHIDQTELTLIGEGATRPTVFGELWLGFGGGGMRVACSRIDWDSSAVSSHIGTVVQWSPGGFLHLDQSTLRTETGVGVLSRGAPPNGVQLLSHCDLLGDEPFFATIEQTSDGTLILQDCIVTHGLGAPETALWVERGVAYSSGTVFHGDILESSGQHVTLPNTLELDHSTLTNAGTLSIAATGTPNGGSVLLCSAAPLTTGVSGGFGTLLMGAPVATLILAYDAAGSWSITLPLPTHPLLVGLPIYLQAFDATAHQLSELEGGILGS